MSPKSNPLRLNKLQLKTLTLFQELARHPESSTRDGDSGEIMISNMPNPHGNHFHIGNCVVLSRDATGLHNNAVWTALERKGLARSAFPMAFFLTPEGERYETGLAQKILVGADH